MSDRFRWLIDESAPRTGLWDTDLTPSAPFATVPSKGAIVAGWLLTLPRTGEVNLASLNVNDRQVALKQARKTAAKVDDPSARTFMFEHGPVKMGSPTGCGVDYAHLHTVPLTFDPMELVSVNDNIDWREIVSEDPWQGLGDRDYLIIGDGVRWLIGEPDAPESQFFRKLIAKQVNQGYGWDHNGHSWISNVRATIDQFGLRA